LKFEIVSNANVQMTQNSITGYQKITKEREKSEKEKKRTIIDHMTPNLCEVK